MYCERWFLEFQIFQIKAMSVKKWAVRSDPVLIRFANCEAEPACLSTTQGEMRKTRQELRTRRVAIRGRIFCWSEGASSLRAGGEGRLR
jgi:hypothetical protein